MLGYLINQYPLPSLTFIRREIAAVEGLGHPVRRYALRAWRDRLVDPQDQAEASRTKRVLAAGAFGLFLRTLITVLTHPLRFLRATAAAWRLGGRSQRGRLVHLVYLAEACVLRAWLRADGITHLHVHFGTNSTTVALLCRLLGGPRFSFTVHGPEEFDQPIALSLGEKIEHAAVVVAISSFGRSQLLRWTRPENWPKVRVVRCGVDPIYLERTPVPVPATPKLVNIGRLSEQKGQLLLVDAAARLRELGREFELVVIGDGELRAMLEARIAALHLESHVKLVGWQTGEQVREHLLSSRGLVLASFAEGLPVVIMEALALHRPVVTTHIAGIPELVVPGETGWLVPAGDVEALANAMTDLLDAPPAVVERMADLGARLVACNHDARTEAKKLLALIELPPKSAGSP